MTGSAHAKSSDESKYEVSEDDPALEDDVNMGKTHVLLDGYPYGATSDGAVVDLGGSHGFMVINTAWQPLELPVFVQNLPKAIVVVEGQFASKLIGLYAFHDSHFVKPCC